MSQLIQ
jgi:hypothetical protein